MELEDINLKELIESETGSRFNREHAICCPFHSEKTASFKVKFLSDANKERYMCHGCGETGDAVDFIMKTKNMDYPQAREYLGIPLEKTIQELEIDKVKSYIEWEIKTLDHRRGLTLLGLFSFVDRDNKPLYYKAKFKAADGKKSLSYYHVDAEDKVKNKRNGDEVFYNLYNVFNAIRDNKTIIITEGEKDANTLNSILRNKDYIATSGKGIKDFSILHYAKVFICGDTGEAGKKYIEKIKFELLEDSMVFKVIILQGIKDLGDNKDVTDWLESGHTKNDLFKAFNRSLDLKSRYELQQDIGGIFKFVKGKGDDAELTKTYISNFTLLEATRINFIDKEQEGVKVVLKSPTGAMVERIDVVTVFDDVKAFKGFLGSLDLSFTGSIGDLTNLKTWINNYFAIDLEERHTGVKFVNKDNVRMLVTNDGAVTKDKINTSIKSDEGTEVNIAKVEEITPVEMKEIMKNLFTFATFGKTFSIIGSLASFLMTEQMVTLKIKNHHLNMVGESGSGKSTILENVIAPIFNYPKNDIKSVGLITPFALIKNLSDGNYPILFDEYKPSSLDKFKNLKLSETLRNLYDRSTVSRSDKSFKNRNFQLNRPLVLAGEESYPNSEKPLIERSCIVYLSKIERVQKHTDSMQWLTENDKILNKLGKSLINIILDLSSEDYQAIRNNVAIGIGKMKDRPLNTCINICSGIEVFNLLLKKLNLKQISNYTEVIVKNIREEVLDNKEEASSQVEMMLIQYNSMIEDSRARDVDNVIIRSSEGLFIKSSEMINQINEYVRSVNSTWVPLELKDFRKQAMKAGYITGKGDKSIYSKSLVKLIRYDTCDAEKFRNLDVSSIMPQEIEDVTDLDNVIPFKDSDNKKETMNNKSKGMNFTDGI